MESFSFITAIISIFLTFVIVLSTNDTVNVLMYLGILLINIVFLTIWATYYLSYSLRLYARAFRKKFPKQYEILAIFLKKTGSRITSKNSFLGKFLSRKDEPKKKEEHKEQLSESVKILESLKSFEKIGYGNRKIKKIDMRALSPKKCAFLEKK